MELNCFHWSAYPHRGIGGSTLCAKKQISCIFGVGPQRSRIFHPDSKPLEGMEQINES
jgi:hypothetical protein